MQAMVPEQMLQRAIADGAKSDFEVAAIRLDRGSAIGVWLQR